LPGAQVETELLRWGDDAQIISRTSIVWNNGGIIDALGNRWSTTYSIQGNVKATTKLTAAAVVQTTPWPLFRII
jgi:hypothetical protein